MSNLNRKKIETEIVSKFKVCNGFKLEKDGGHWWFIVDSDLEFGSVYLLTSFTALWQNSLEEWVAEFSRCYTRHFGCSPTLKAEVSASK